MMRTFKVPALASVITLSAVVLFGCPIYSSSEGYVTCNSQGVCCDQSDNCSTWTCGSNAECPSSASCNNGLCTPGGGYDGGYYGGDAQTDCSTTGCPTGYQCTLANGSGTPVCVANGDAGSGDATVHDGGGGDSASKDVQTPPFTGCTSDQACATDSGAGARCLNGTCVAAANECSDSTQCVSIGGSPEAGVCTPTCSASIACPAGYSCSTDGTNVCTGNPTPCGGADGGQACASGTTCVDQHCVPPCSAADAGTDSAGSCSAGFVCVDHGCIPDQAPQFICQNDGVQDNCAAGSICLHHNCYIACSIDAGVGCQQADNFNICKPVATSSGTYDVCGSNSNLGNQCDPTDPTLGKICSSPAICIDGYCR